MIKSKTRRQTFIVSFLTLLSCLAILATPLAAQNSIDVRVGRWLQVQSVTGDVEWFTASTRAPAKVGDLLQVPGDGVRTGADSACTINVGTITLQAHTELVVRELDFASDNGTITRLSVPKGNVTLNLRRFTHRGSELEIETPSGVSGVRGTEFGIIVHPDDQRTAIATESGEVFAAAEGTTVTVLQGFKR